MAETMPAIIKKKADNQDGCYINGLFAPFRHAWWGSRPLEHGWLLMVVSDVKVMLVEGRV